MKPVHVYILMVLSVVIAGCGGGGGGGGGTVTPPSSDNSVAVLSGVSPASMSVISTRTPTVTFTSNVTATCRWSASDSSYSQMTSACTGGGTTSHSCAASFIGDGGNYVYISCRTSDGAEDTSATNENIYYTVDTAAPAITIDYPSTGGSYLSNSLPSRIEISYSDTGIGPDPSSIDVSFTLRGRTLSISDLFGTDATANAASSRTDAAVTDPLKMTSVTVFGNSSFSSAGDNITVRRSGSSTLRMEPAGTDSYIVWDTAGIEATLVSITTGAETDFSFPANPIDVAVSQTSGKLFAIFASNEKLYIYDTASPASYTTTSFSSSLKTISYNSGTDHILVTRESSSVIAVWDCSAGAMASSFSAAAEPVMAEPVSGGTDKLVTVSFSAGSARLYLSDSSGTSINTIIGTQYPQEIAVDSTGGYALASMPTDDKVVVVNLATGVKTDIAVGDAPSALISGPNGEVAVMNTGDGTVSIISTGTLAVSSTKNPGTLISDGIYYAGSGSYIVAEDLWNTGYLQANSPLTITAAIQDGAGNSGPVQATIYVSPDTP